MPQLGETVTEGTITRWFKAVGDTVTRDEPLFEVSTDKVDSEVPSPAEGVVTSILVEEGDTVDVGATLAVIDPAGVPATPASSGSAPAARTRPGSTCSGRSRTYAPAPTPPAALHSATPPAAPAPAPPAAPAPAPTPAPARSSAAVRPAAGASLKTELPDEPVVSERPPTASSVPTSSSQAPRGASSSDGSSGLVLSPVVRKLLADHEIDPSTVRGTGLEGRITRSDVEAVIARQGGAADPSPVPSIVDRSEPAAAPQARTAPPEPAPPAPVRPVAAPPAPAPPHPHVLRPRHLRPLGPLPRPHHQHQHHQRPHHQPRQHHLWYPPRLRARRVPMPSVPAHGTRWCRSPTSGVARLSTWSARKRSPPTP